MANTLVRVPDRTVTLGSPPVAPTPERCITEITGYRTEQVTVVGDTTTPPGEWLTNSDGEFVFVPDTPGGYGGVRTGTSGTRTVTQTVPVYSTTCTPGSPGSPGSPTRVHLDYGPDWQSSAKSIKFVAEGARLTFKVKGNAAVGLTALRALGGVPLSAVDYGVAIVDGSVHLLRGGAVLGDIGPAAAYESYEVTVRQGRGEIHGVAAGTPTLLNTSVVPRRYGLFAAGLVHDGVSHIDSPQLTALTTVEAGVSARLGLTGTSTGRLQAPTPTRGELGLSGHAFGSVNGVRAVSAIGRVGLTHGLAPSVRRLFADTGGVQAAGRLPLGGHIATPPISGVSAHIPRMTLYAGNLTGGYGEVTLSHMTLDAGSNPPAPTAQFATAELHVGAPMVQGWGSTGGIGGSALAVSPMDVVASDYPYSYGSPAVPRMFVSAGGGVVDMSLGRLREYVGVFDAYDPLVAILVEFSSGLDVQGDLGVVVALDAAMEVALGITDSMTLSQILSVVLEEKLVVTDTQSTPSGGYQQYVYNLLSGAVSRFDGFGFDGFVHHEGSTFAYSRSGVHKVTDVPADPIHAMLDLGATTFGVSSAKHIETAFIGLGTDGQVFLKLSADGLERVYRVVQRSPTMRAHTGRGVVGREWACVLQIMDATSATLDDVEFVLAASGRRWTR